MGSLPTGMVVDVAGLCLEFYRVPMLGGGSWFGIFQGTHAWWP